MIFVVSRGSTSDSMTDMTGAGFVITSASRSYRQIIIGKSVSTMT